MSLCVGLTINTAKASEEIVTIIQGQKAPFTGNLMPVSIFSKMMADAEMEDAISHQLKLCQQERAECVTAQDSDSTKWFGSGFVIGLISVLIVKEVAK